MKERLIPRSFFVTSGFGVADDPLISFDAALRDAGIGECNLVEVSSILPANALEVERYEIKPTPGEITFCVVSRMDGESGEVTGASIGYGWLESEKERGKRDFGIICEHHGYYSREYLRENVKEKLYKMAKIRGKKLINEQIYAKSEEIKEGKYGSVIVAIVFLFERKEV